MNENLRSRWQGMKQRCNNPNDQAYPNYGGRGIKVCDRWLDSFDNFYADMGDCPKGYSIERRDNDAGYNPDNCVWATSSEQNYNKRNNTFFTYHGVSKLFYDWNVELELEETLGISVHAIYCRIMQYGWTVEDAFTLPAKKVTEYYVKGEMLSINGISEKYSIPVESIKYKISRGVVGDALSIAFVAGPAELFTVNGVTKTVNEWSKACRRSQSTTRKWLIAGTPLTSASTRDGITFMGETLPMGVWATKWGITNKELSHYLRTRLFTMQEIYDYYIMGGDWAPIGSALGKQSEPIEFDNKSLSPTIWREKFGLTPSQFSKGRKKKTMAQIAEEVGYVCGR